MIRTIKATSNKRRRTFTIRVYLDGVCTSKYRTIKQSKEDFHYYSNFATQRDWEQFLKTDEYYRVN